MVVVVENDSSYVSNIVDLPVCLSDDKESAFSAQLDALSLTVDIRSVLWQTAKNIGR